MHRYADRPQQLKALPEAIGLMCMEGDICCVQTGNACVYTLTQDIAIEGKNSALVVQIPVTVGATFFFD